MSDDEDYMSDKFLQGSEKHIPSSLIYRHSDRREFALMKKRTEIESKLKQQNKSIRVVEAEKREEGLSSAIASTNKGLYTLHTYYMDIHIVYYTSEQICNENIFKKIILICDKYLFLVLRFWNAYEDGI